MKMSCRTEYFVRSLLVSATLGAVLSGCDRGADLSEMQIFPDRTEAADSAADGHRPAFADVPATPDPGLRPAPVDFDTHPLARQFRTLLASGAAEGPNFAGHYTIVSWGCGTMCEEFMIVDARTGEIFDGRTTAVGVEYRLDSRLLLVNPPAAAAASRCTEAACLPQYFVWTDSRLEPVMLEDEREAIRSAAIDHIRRETAVSEVSIEVDAVAEGWARVRAHPLGEETDPAVLYLQKEGAGWRVVALGTGFAPEDLDRIGVPSQARPAP